MNGKVMFQISSILQWAKEVAEEMLKKDVDVDMTKVANQSLVVCRKSCGCVMDEISAFEIDGNCFSVGSLKVHDA